MRPVADVTSVSVVVPCYNAESFIAETLDSICAQTHAPTEILVIDDGSTDSSAAIVERFSDRVRLIRQDNQGESHARNRGLSEATGHWVAFLDADDLWEPTKLEKQIACATSATVCVHSPYRDFGSRSATCDGWLRVSEPVRYSLSYMSWRPFIIPSAAMVRRNISARFPVWTQYGEDLLFFLELLGEGQFSHHPELLVRHRCHPAAQSAQRAIEIEWHKSVRTWIGRQGAQVSADTRDEVEAGWQRRLTTAATKSLLQGRYREYNEYRRYLSGLGTGFPVGRTAARWVARCLNALSPFARTSGDKL